MKSPRDSRRRFLQQACGLLACGAAPSLLPQLGLIRAALAQSSPASGYKALVCLFLNGGNDGWNLLVPGEATAYGKYQQARNGVYHLTANAGGLALPRWNEDGYVPLQTPPPTLPLDGGQFGLNPFCPELAQLYAENRLAFVANVGPLVEPTTIAQFNQRRRPPQLYSHNDQTNLWHIGSGNSTQITEGWGGRVAGRVARPSGETAGLPPTVSLSGLTRFLTGKDLLGVPLFPFALTDSTTSPATSLLQYSASNSTPANQFQQVRRAALEELLDAASPQAFTDEYRAIVGRSLRLADQVINPAITGISAADRVNGGGTSGFDWPTGFSLADQLKQIAKLIRVSTSQPDNPGFDSPVGANRQVFFVSIGGFDTHDGQITSAGATGHHQLLQQVSQAVAAFYRAMQAIGRHNDVTLFSASEFGRTINSNGNGSDHAWGSVQFAVGGAVNGGQVIGRYPSIVLNNSLPGSGSVSDNAQLGECFARGQFIPTIAVDQFSATLARWMGVTDGELPLIFPNIDNFATGPFANPVSTPSFAQFGRILPGLLNGIV